MTKLADFTSTLVISLDKPIADTIVTEFRLKNTEATHPVAKAIAGNVGGADFGNPLAVRGILGEGTQIHVTALRPAKGIEVLSGLTNVKQVAVLGLK